MDKRIIRLGSTITFDSKMEKDIADRVDNLSSSRKLGPLISNILRVVLESPETVVSQEKLIKAVEEVDKYGMTKERHDFFSGISKEIEQMKHKVDAMYDMNTKLVAAAKFGKAMGIEDKTKNMLAAQFTLEKQLNEITSKLGITHTNHIFKSDRIHDVYDRADETLEFIIDTHGNILSELEELINKKIEINVNVSGASGVDLSKQVEEQKSISKETKGIKLVGKDNTFDDSKVDESDIVDFGDADIGALDSFFGG